jgi:peptidoglycan/LPS O-acetylase OafA/YrhL
MLSSASMGDLRVKRPVSTGRFLAWAAAAPADVMAHMKYVPALDGLRAIAILMVLVFHAHGPIAHGGFVGVDVFFVLSGFLITSLLLAERDATGGIDLRAFYRRRLLRLTPPLFAMLAVYLVIAPLAWPRGHHVASALVSALYLADYGRAFWGVPWELVHMWSLSVEEHYYLLWPLLLLLSRRRWTGRHLAIALGAAYVAATLWRAACIAHGQTWEQVYFRFDTRFSGIVLGSALAASAREPALLATVRRYVPAAIWWLPVVALGVSRYELGSTEVATWGFTVIELATAAVLIDVLQQPAGLLARALSRPALVWFGTMSYGVYLWHYPVFKAMRDAMGWPWWLQIAAGTPLSVGIAALSFHTIEAFARRRRLTPAVLTRPNRRSTA